MTERKRLIVILGPTAVGKTAISVELAAALNGEIISGDSMQVYRRMDIGTAKILEYEKYAKDGTYIPHYLIDIKDPDEQYTVMDFQREATALVEEINDRGKMPIIAGGTGFYISALIDGYTFNADDGADDDFRKRKQQEYAEKGGYALHEELKAIDPEAAAKISPNDAKRLIRALEVFNQSGEKISESGKNPPDWDIILIGLNRDRAELYDRINKRVDYMLDKGFQGEVRGLLSAGYGHDLKPMQALGYKQLGAYISGECEREEAIEEIKTATRHFAKRQLTWWRKDERVRWLDLTGCDDPTERLPELLELCKFE